MLKYLLSIVGVFAFCNCVFAGSTYEITSIDGDRVTKYNVQFGGGFLFDQMTAFDPVSQKFVYLKWQHDQPEPQPVGSIWDPATGKKTELYQFPGVAHPLPVIKSIKDIKTCPFTGSKEISAKVIEDYD